MALQLPAWIGHVIKAVEDPYGTLDSIGKAYGGGVYQLAKLVRNAVGTTVKDKVVAAQQTVQTVLDTAYTYLPAPPSFDRDTGDWDLTTFERISLWVDVNIDQIRAARLLEWIEEEGEDTMPAFSKWTENEWLTFGDDVKTLLHARAMFEQHGHLPAFVRNKAPIDWKWNPAKPPNQYASAVNSTTLALEASLLAAVNTANVKPQQSFNGLAVADLRGPAVLMSSVVLGGARGGVAGVAATLTGVAVTLLNITPMSQQLVKALAAAGTGVALNAHAGVVGAGLLGGALTTFATVLMVHSATQMLSYIVVELAPTDPERRATIVRAVDFGAALSVVYGAGQVIENDGDRFATVTLYLTAAATLVADKISTANDPDVRALEDKATMLERVTASLGPNLMLSMEVVGPVVRYGYDRAYDSPHLARLIYQGSGTITGRFLIRIGGLAHGYHVQILDSKFSPLIDAKNPFDPIQLAVGYDRLGADMDLYEAKAISYADKWGARLHYYHGMDTVWSYLGVQEVTVDAASFGQNAGVLRHVLDTRLAPPKGGVQLSGGPPTDLSKAKFLQLRNKRPTPASPTSAGRPTLAAQTAAKRDKKYVAGVLASRGKVAEPGEAPPGPSPAAQAQGKPYVLPKGVARATPQTGTAHIDASKGWASGGERSHAGSLTTDKFGVASITLTTELAIPSPHDVLMRIHAAVATHVAVTMHKYAPLVYGNVAGGALTFEVRQDMGRAVAAEWLRAYDVFLASAMPRYTAYLIQAADETEKKQEIGPAPSSQQEPAGSAVAPPIVAPEPPYLEACVTAQIEPVGAAFSEVVEVPGVMDTDRPFYPTDQPAGAPPPPAKVPRFDEDPIERPRAPPPPDPEPRDDRADPWVGSPAPPPPAPAYPSPAVPRQPNQVVPPDPGNADEKAADRVGDANEGEVVMGNDVGGGGGEWENVPQPDSHLAPPGPRPPAPAPVRPPNFRKILDQELKTETAVPEPDVPRDRDKRKEPEEPSSDSAGASVNKDEEKAKKKKNKKRKLWNPIPPPDESVEDTLELDSVIQQALRPFMANAGSDAFEATPEEQELKMNNLMLGQVRPAGWPNGGLDNKIWTQNVALEGLHQASPLFNTPVHYMGGTLRQGDDLFGRWDPNMPARSLLRDYRKFGSCRSK